MAKSSKSWSTNLQDQEDDFKVLCDFPYKKIIFSRGSGYHG
tara:strand:+ start:1017 stop:1139 length:123 start_codon:yes stop_codon:yes gene_type:complete